MRNIWVILRRETLAYFTRPLGYIYLVAFILFTNLLGLFFVQPGFFEYPVADMRRYFHVFAGVAAFLVAASSMRLWAEDRESNTYEMLLTLPMRASHLVVGKFLASLAFYAVALVCTMTVPLMMIVLSRSGAGDVAETGFFGMLDIQATLSGYFGALLLGAFFISFGLFVSGLCRDQIVAFVLTAPVLFVAYFLGVDFIRNALDSALAFLGEGMGTTLGDAVGIFWHFDNLVRGLITGADILFFLIWTVIFLVLNGLAIERRHRPHATEMYVVSALLLFGIGLMGNYITADFTLGRKDVTEDQIFTVDEVSLRVLTKLKDPVKVRYVVSPQSSLPGELQNLERDVQDKLDALRLASGGMLQYKIIHREPMQALKEEAEAAEAESEEESIEKRILKNIKPFSVEVLSGGKETAQLVYSGLELSYLDKESEVISPLMPRNLPQLEYFLIKFIHKMTREEAPVVALVAPKQEIPPQLAQLYQQMGRPVPPPMDPYEYLEAFLKQENYQVQRVKLTRNSPLPESYDVLAVVEPQNLNERQQWELNRALVNGNAVFLAAQSCAFDYQARRGGLEIRKQELNPGINRVLLSSGIRLAEGVLMDPRGETIQVPVQTPLGYLPQTFPELPLHAVIKPDGMNKSYLALQGVDTFRYYWGSALKLDEKLLEKNGIEMTPLMKSSRGSWTREIAGQHLKNEDIEASHKKTAERLLVAARFDGQFQDAFADAEPPEWPDPKRPPMPGQPPPPDADPGPIEPAPGTLVLVGNAKVFSKQFISRSELNFFLNCMGMLGLDETGQAIRALQTKTQPLRAIGAFSPDDPFWRSDQFWKIIQVLGHAVILSLVGLAVFLHRSRRRDAYVPPEGSK